MKTLGKDETFWQLCLPMKRSDKEQIRAISRKYGTTYPALVSALLRGVLAKGLAEELLCDKELPMRYGRRERPTAAQIVNSVRKTPHAPESPAPLPPEREPDAETPQARQETFRKLCEMWELPGRNLDEECDRALETWIANWGDLTSAEEQLLFVARDKRHAAYRQWREEVAKLEDLIAVVEAATERQKQPRQQRLLKRRVERLHQELSEFLAKVRWDERHFDQLPTELK